MLECHQNFWVNPTHSLPGSWFLKTQLYQKKILPQPRHQAGASQLPAQSTEPQQGIEMLFGSLPQSLQDVAFISQLAQLLPTTPCLWTGKRLCRQKQPKRPVTKQGRQGHVCDARPCCAQDQSRNKRKKYKREGIGIRWRLAHRQISLHKQIK